MTVLAKGSDYFGTDGFAITARMVRTEPDGAPSHPCDVTELDHFHDFTELVLVLAGRGIHVLETESFPVSAGDVFVIQGRQVHRFCEREDLLLLNIMYDPELLPLPLNYLRRLPGYSALFLLEPNYRSQHGFSSRLRLKRVPLGIAQNIGERIGEESAAAGPGHEAMLLSHLVGLIVFLSRHYARSDATESLALLRMGELISALERRYNESWELADMARFASLSRSSLLRFFRQATGKSPIAYLIELRVEAAKKLLRQSDQSITDIAFATGFSDSNYFARQFRLLTGLTPSAYRQREHSQGTAL